MTLQLKEQYEVSANVGAGTGVEMPERESTAHDAALARTEEQILKGKVISQASLLNLIRS
jgi:hypothetical protein